MICPKCRSTMNDNYNFCTICGTRLYSRKEYSFPPLALLHRGNKDNIVSDEHFSRVADSLKTLFISFGVGAHVVNVTCGPIVSRYEIQLEPGVSVHQILSLNNDIKMLFHTENINIEAPIPGHALIGISVPNPSPSMVFLREIIESTEYIEKNSKLIFAVGKDMVGNNIVSAIDEMPHLLIGGSTGSGKSIFIHALILSIIYKTMPDEAKFILIDTKAIELNKYNGTPHLLFPVITNPIKAAKALSWTVTEMEKRYRLLATLGERNIDRLNERAENTSKGTLSSLPKIIIIIDNISDIIENFTDSEASIIRLTQYGRAVGIHIIITSSLPCSRCVSPLIKSNLLSRISFHTASKLDSRTILGESGAEILLPSGDMLFYPSGYRKPVRIRSPFVSDKEVHRVVDFLIHNYGNRSYSTEQKEHINRNAIWIDAESEKKKKETPILLRLAD